MPKGEFVIKVEVDWEKWDEHLRGIVEDGIKQWAKDTLIQECFMVDARKRLANHVSEYYWPIDLELEVYGDKNLPVSNASRWKEVGDDDAAEAED